MCLWQGVDSQHSHRNINVINVYFKFGIERRGRKKKINSP